METSTVLTMVAHLSYLPFSPLRKTQLGKPAFDFTRDVAILCAVASISFWIGVAETLLVLRVLDKL